MSDVMFIQKRMHRSPAFRKLTASSILVLLEFLSRRQMVKIGRRDRWVTKNNGEIVLTYTEITAKFRIARSTFRNSLVKMGEYWGRDMCCEQSTLIEVRHSTRFPFVSYVFPVS